MVGTSRKAAPARQFTLGDLATNRILFALALLGVLLPLGAIVSRYHHLDFIYYWPHNTFFKGPYHLHLNVAYYLMEGLLAAAVYLYGFDFIFRSKIFERLGTTAYALSLLAPPTYLYVWTFQHLGNLINNFSGLLYWPLLFVISLPFSILFWGVFVISRRLQD